MKSEEMLPDESLAQVVRLLELLPAVAVEASWRREGSVHIELSIASEDSLVRVIRNAEFTNIPVYVRLRSPRGAKGKASEADEVRYGLELSETQDFDCPPSQLEIFGIFLARHLKHRGLLSATEADGLQKAWNAAVY